MENWKKVILGVVLSFMALFTCVGYAALNDTLTISGILNASMPEEIFITEIELVSGSASISGLTQITVTEAGMFEITVCNNTSNKYVYTGSNPAVTATETENGASIGTVRDSTDAYVAGVDLKQIDPKTDEPTYVTFYVQCDSTGTIEFNFQSFIYKISYINNGDELDARYVYDNSNPVNTENDVAQKAAMNGITDNNVEFKAWINAGSTVVTSVKEDNTEDVELFPSYENLYTAMFVDLDGNILAWDTFTATTTGYNKIIAMGTEELAPEIEDLLYDGWEVHETDENGNTISIYALSDLASNFGMIDISIYPSYQYNGDVRLEPVDNDGDGKTDEWKVAGYRDDEGIDMVQIPDVSDSKPVVAITSGAFSSYPDLHCVTIPTTVTFIDDFAFAEDWSNTNPFDSGETQTIYYEGSYQQWQENMQWNTEAFSGLSDDSRIFFLNGGTTVDPSQGYLQVEKTNSGAWYSPEYIGSLTYYDKSNIDQSLIDAYTKACDCGKDVHTETNGLRPDYIYWENVQPVTLKSDVTEAAEIQLIWDGIDTTNLVWYPVDEQNPVPGDSYEIAFEPAEGYVMAEILTVFIDDTEYAVQTDGSAPEGETVPTYDPERNVLTIPAALLTAETKTVSVVALAVPAEETDPTEETAGATDPTEETTEATDPTEETAEATDPTEETAEATDSTEETAGATDPTEETAGATDPTE